MREHLLKTLLLLSLSASPLLAQEAAEKKISFDEHVKPIFREHCTACHSEGDKASDLALDSFAGTLAGGSSGSVIAEGNASSSRLFKLITHAERPFMPPDQDPIPKAQIELLQTWIEQGTPENAGSKIKRSNNAAAAMLSTSGLGKPEGPPPMPEALLLQPVTETVRSAAIAAMAASPWAPLVVVGGQEQVSCYHSETGDLLGVIPFPEGEPQSLTFTRDGRQLLIAGGRHSHSGCAVLVDIASGERITKVGDELDVVLAADISPDKQRIALAGPSKIVRVFDTASGELVSEMKKHTDWIFALRYSPDGVLLATGDRSNGLIVWEADSGRVYSELKGHTGEVRTLDFRSDSNVLASGSLDGNIKLWDMFESKEIKSWAAHGGGVTALMYAQNGLLASAGHDARVKLWNGNGELQKEFPGLGEAALEVALTGDAAYVAGGDWNGQIKLWPATDPAQSKMIAANPPSITTRIEQTQATLQATQAELATAEQAAQAAAAAAAASQAQRDVVASRMAAAQAAVDKALADKAALDARASELEQTKQQATQLVATLQTQLQAVAERQTTQQSAAEKLATEVQALTDQMAALQMRIAEAQQSQQQAAQNLQKQTEESATLKGQLETAEQAAAEAQERQLLFLKAYDPSADIK